MYKKVRELSSVEDLSTIKSIYEKGNKIVVLFKEDEYLGIIESNIEDSLLEDWGCLVSDGLFAIGGKEVLIEKITSAPKDGTFAHVYPIKGNKDVFVSYLLYNVEDKIADKVWEVCVEN